MKIDHETNIEISIVTDFITCKLENEIFYRLKVKIKDILRFFEILEEMNIIKTSIYRNSFLASFYENIICINILNSKISWDDIITYKNMYNYYEKM